MNQSDHRTAGDWFLKEWLRFRGRKQADMVRELEWDRARVSRLASGEQPFTRDDLAAVSLWLKIEPHELLMAPSEAEGLRRLRAVAEDIVKGASGATRS